MAFKSKVVFFKKNSYLVLNVVGFVNGMRMFDFKDMVQFAALKLAILANCKQEEVMVGLCKPLFADISAPPFFYVKVEKCPNDVDLVDDSFFDV